MNETYDYLTLFDTLETPINNNNNIDKSSGCNTLIVQNPYQLTIKNECLYFELESSRNDVKSTTGNSNHYKTRGDGRDTNRRLPL